MMEKVLYFCIIHLFHIKNGMNLKYNWRSYQSTNKEDSLKFTQSSYKHDVEIPDQIINENHPIGLR